MILKNTYVCHGKSESFKYDYSRFKEDSFVEDFNQIDFSYLENGDLNLNNKFHRFLKDLKTLTNKHAPIRRSRKEMKPNNKQWINNRILKMMRIRDRILQKLKKHNLKLYKKFRNRSSNELKESKARYSHHYFSKNSQNMKKLRSGIKTFISHKSSTFSSINEINGKDRNTTSDPSKMSHILNDFYVNVADGITETIPLIPKSPIDYLLS